MHAYARYNFENWRGKNFHEYHNMVWNGATSRQVKKVYFLSMLSRSSSYANYSLTSLSLQASKIQCCVKGLVIQLNMLP